MNLKIYDNPSIIHLTELIEDNPKDADKYFQRSIGLFNLGEDRLSLKDLQKAISLNPQNPEYYNALGFLSQEMGDIAASVKAFQQLVALAPEKDEFKLLLINAYSLNKEHERALLGLNKLLEKDGKNLELKYFYAKLLAQNNDTLEALKAVEYVIQQQPNYESALFLKADILSQQHNHEAANIYQLIYNNNPQNINALYALAKHYDQTHDYTNAKAAYRSVILQDMEYIYAYINIAKILIKQDSLESAKRQLQLALQRSPAEAEAYLYLAEVMEMQNNKDSASMYWQIYKRFNPEGKSK